MKSSPGAATLDIHQRLTEAVRTCRVARHTVARLLVQLDRQALAELGYDTVQDYAMYEHDLSPRVVRDLLYLGRSLADLPVLDAALGAGELAWTKARTMLPVLVADNEAAWVAAARDVPVRVLEGMIATSLAGEPRPTHVRHGRPLGLGWPPSASGCSPTPRASPRRRAASTARGTSCRLAGRSSCRAGG